MTAGTGSTTPEDVARWMLAEVQRERALYQEHAVGDIAVKFGDEFTYLNDSGNPAISRRVLRAFARLSADTVVWERGRALLVHEEPGPRRRPGAGMTLAVTARFAMVRADSR